MIGLILLTKESLTKVIVPRKAKSHKGSYGRVVCIGGIRQYGGAIIMCAQACVKSGAGLVTVVTDVATIPALHSRLPEAMALSFQDQEALQNVLATADVIVIGPGLGVEKEAFQLLKLVLQQQTKDQWLVIDGSAITLLADHPVDFLFPEHLVLTPHQKEWERFSGLALKEQTIPANWHAQKKLGITLVLKSEQTHIYTNHEQYQNTFGNPAMATGGMGDTLAGIIGGFLGQFGHTDLQAEAAICAAVTIHSFIADELAKDAYVVLPTEIANHLPQTMRKFCPFAR